MNIQMEDTLPMVLGGLIFLSIVWFALLYRFSFLVRTKKVSDWERLSGQGTSRLIPTSKLIPYMLESAFDKQSSQFRTIARFLLICLVVYVFLFIVLLAVMMLFSGASAMRMI